LATPPPAAKDVIALTANSNKNTKRPKKVKRSTTYTINLNEYESLATAIVSASPKFSIPLYILERLGRIIRKRSQWNEWFAEYGDDAVLN
jgi:hypothetical protein